MRLRRFFIMTIAILALVMAIATPQYANTPIISYESRHHPVIAKDGMVASQHYLGTKVGVDILKQGGNAIDAAVAVGFALAVVLPRAGNLGGGGFMMVHIASENRTIALDYRETAPGSAHKDMFLDAAGEPDTQKSRHSLLATGTPGTVYGLTLALDTYGTLPLSTVIAPAIALAEQGFRVDDDLAFSLLQAKNRLAKDSTAQAVFYPNGKDLNTGDTLYQKDLAKSLRQIQKHGRTAFYTGKIADQIATYMQQNGGLIRKGDLSDYRAVERTPIHDTYRGYDIYAMPPPSSGGVILIEMLNMLEHYPLHQYGHNSAMSIHVMSEVMKRAYADRSKWLGDPDFTKMPISELTSKAFAKKRINSLPLDKSTASTSLSPYPFSSAYESDETTHFSVVDKWGNAVSNTYTLNFSYGNAKMVPGTGILLNNEMDDFSAKPGVANAYGLIGGKKNAIQPNKRMLSSMTPTIVLKNYDLFLVTGTPGGSRIITTVLQLLTNTIDYKMNIAEATHAPRIHHQWHPDEIRHETGISSDTLELLNGIGHQTSLKTAMGSAQSIMKRNNTLYGASDPRKPGAAVIGLPQN